MVKRVLETAEASAHVRRRRSNSEMQKRRASITQIAPDDASARAQTELHCRDDVRYWLRQAGLEKVAQCQ